ncbi:MAG: GNAT family N-acetyltransferase, partial [Bacteroidota bacterium]
KALQKAKGSLVPFGFIHVLKSFFFGKHIDLFLIGIKPEYQKMGAAAVIIDTLTNTFIRKGINYVTNGPALEDNHAVLNSWKEFNLEPKIRRSCFHMQF